MGKGKFGGSRTLQEASLKSWFLCSLSLLQGGGFHDSKILNSRKRGTIQSSFGRQRGRVEAWARELGWGGSPGQVLISLDRLFVTRRLPVSWSSFLVRRPWEELESRVRVDGG